MLDLDEPWRAKVLRIAEDFRKLFAVWHDGRIFNAGRSHSQLAD
jgi:hypothetical protein